METDPDVLDSGAAETAQAHRRPPGDRLFCNVAAARAEHPGLKPAIPLGEREAFASHFADNFAAALCELGLLRGC